MELGLGWRERKAAGKVYIAMGKWQVGDDWSSVPRGVRGRRLAGSGKRDSLEGRRACVAVRVSHHGGGGVRRSASVSSCMACGLQVSVFTFQSCSPGCNSRGGSLFGGGQLTTYVLVDYARPRARRRLAGDAIADLNLSIYFFKVGEVMPEKNSF